MTELWAPDELTLQAELTRSAPLIPWDTFMDRHFKPTPGEHVAIIGQNGSGKTHLMNEILPCWPFSVVFATKPVDSTMDWLVKHRGYERFTAWRSLNPRDHPRRVIWPDATRLDSRANQTRVFRSAMERIFMERGKNKSNPDKPIGWALAIDELWYVVNRLELKSEVEQFLFQSRSLGHSLLLATQRPFYVPSSVYDQSTHLFFFRVDEYRALQRLGEIQTSNRRIVRHAIQRLDRHQILYVNTKQEFMLRTRTPPPQKGL